VRWPSSSLAPSTQLEVAEDAGRSDAAQLDPLAAEDDMKDVAPALLEALEGRALQLRGVADAEHTQGRVVARKREDVPAVEQRHQAKLAAERQRMQRAVAAEVAPRGLLVAHIRPPGGPWTATSIA
jgi:hypothetical protein